MNCINTKSDAYKEGFKCGRSPTGQSDENPHKHRLSKERKEWHQGWMDGGAIYLNECQKCMSSPCRCALADALAGWITTTPDSEGVWEMRCMENGQKSERMTVEMKCGDLWVNCSTLGWNPLQHYHDNLAEIQWRNISAITNPKDKIPK